MTAFERFLLTFLLLFLATFHLITHWFHTHKNVPYWVCALGIAAFAPVAILHIYIPLGLYLLTKADPYTTHCETVAWLELIK